MASTEQNKEWRAILDTIPLLLESSDEDFYRGAMLYLPVVCSHFSRIQLSGSEHKQPTTTTDENAADPLRMKVFLLSVVCQAVSRMLGNDVDVCRVGQCGCGPGKEKDMKTSYVLPKWVMMVKDGILHLLRCRDLWIYTQECRSASLSQQDVKQIRLLRVAQREICAVVGGMCDLYGAGWMMCTDTRDETRTLEFMKTLFGYIHMVTALSLDHATNRCESLVRAADEKEEVTPATTSDNNDASPELVSVREQVERIKAGDLSAKAVTPGDLRVTSTSTADKTIRTAFVRGSEVAVSKLFGQLVGGLRLLESMRLAVHSAALTHRFECCGAPVGLKSAKNNSVLSFRQCGYWTVADDTSHSHLQRVAFVDDLPIPFIKFIFSRMYRLGDDIVALARSLVRLWELGRRLQSLNDDKTCSLSSEGHAALFPQRYAGQTISEQCQSTENSAVMPSGAACRYLCDMLVAGVRYLLRFGEEDNSSEAQRILRGLWETRWFRIIPPWQFAGAEEPALSCTPLSPLAMTEGYWYVLGEASVLRSSGPVDPLVFALSDLSRHVQSDTDAWVAVVQAGCVARLVAMAFAMTSTPKLAPKTSHWLRSQAVVGGVVSVLDLLVCLSERALVARLPGLCLPFSRQLASFVDFLRNQALAPLRDIAANGERKQHAQESTFSGDSSLQTGPGTLQMSAGAALLLAVHLCLNYEAILAVLCQQTESKCHPDLQDTLVASSRLQRCADAVLTWTQKARTHPSRCKALATASARRNRFVSALNRSNEGGECVSERVLTNVDMIGGSDEVCASCRVLETMSVGRGV